MLKHIVCILVLIIMQKPLILYSNIIVQKATYHDWNKRIRQRVEKFETDFIKSLAREINKEILKKEIKVLEQHIFTDNPIYYAIKILNEENLPGHNEALIADDNTTPNVIGHPEKIKRTCRGFCIFSINEGNIRLSFYRCKKYDLAIKQPLIEYFKNEFHAKKLLVSYRPQLPGKKWEKYHSFLINLGFHESNEEVVLFAGQEPFDLLELELID